MVDRKSRDILAENIRHLLAGLITNDEYEDSVSSVNKKDLVVKELLVAIWTLYSDEHEHKLNIEKFSKEDNKTFARFILFLKTDQEYKWPWSNVHDPFIRLLSNVFTLGIYTRKKDNEFLKNGDIKYWPFISKEDFDLAKLKPVYLNNGA